MSVDAPMIEIREWGRPARRRSLNRPLLVGRDCAGELLADDGVSRQHLRLVPTPTALSVIDLGSRNGTTVNGLTLTRRTELAPGDIVRLGSSEIVVLRTPTQQRDFDATRSGLQVVSAPPPPPPPPCEVTPPRWTALTERILGIDPTDRRDMFPAFTDQTSRVPLRVWQALGAAAITAYLATIVVMFVRPAAGQFVFFHVIVPLLPITFFIFFATYRRTTQVQQLEMAPTAFVAKLRARWEQQSAPRPRAAVGATGPSAPDAPTIFISYMREDADAARRLCNAITSLGGDVWLDERRLRPGDAWEREILTHIRRTVRLFVPIISANTERAQEGYVFAEWRRRSIDRASFRVAASSCP